MPSCSKILIIRYFKADVFPLFDFPISPITFIIFFMLCYSPFILAGLIPPA